MLFECWNFFYDEQNGMNVDGLLHCLKLIKMVDMTILPLKKSILILNQHYVSIVTIYEPLKNIIIHEYSLGILNPCMPNTMTVLINNDLS